MRCISEEKWHRLVVLLLGHLPQLLGEQGVVVEVFLVAAVVAVVVAVGKILQYVQKV